MELRIGIWSEKYYDIDKDREMKEVENKEGSILKQKSNQVDKIDHRTKTAVRPLNLYCSNHHPVRRSHIIKRQSEMLFGGRS